MAIAIMTCVTVGIYSRSNRSAVYYPLSLCGLVIILTLFLKLMEIHAIGSPAIQIFISLGLLFFSVVLVLFIHILYVLFTRARFPLIFQMLSGAGALMLFFILMQYTAPVRLAYIEQTFHFQFLLYLLLPYLAFIFYLPLLIILIKKHRLNATGLSFDNVLRIIPDQVLVFDRTGRIIDRNHSDHLFGECQSISELSQTLREQGGKNERLLMTALTRLNQRSQGEIEQTDKNQSFRTWSWTFQPVKNRKGSKIGYILIFSDMTHIRDLSLQLHAQNNELKDINRQLSNYTELIERYSGAAAQKEIADIIDRSVRLKLDQMAQNLSAVSESKSDDRQVMQVMVDAIIRECRLALTDIRSLVYRLTK